MPSSSSISLFSLIICSKFLPLLLRLLLALVGAAAPSPAQEGLGEISEGWAVVRCCTTLSSRFWPALKSEVRFLVAASSEYLGFSLLLLCWFSDVRFSISVVRLSWEAQNQSLPSIFFKLCSDTEQKSRGQNQHEWQERQGGASSTYDLNGRNIMSEHFVLQPSVSMQFTSFFQFLNQASYQQNHVPVSSRSMTQVIQANKVPIVDESQNTQMKSPSANVELL
ncbi:hypothetical protein M9H77_29720 [Catharanthus roseus]|uniref:Uncharacterized protein n=1 Tax=Catharanthus roseus TaxID=4058 RepID=A0ACB9ZXF0_CATRO|nr:hypothetical protein M9H77_29720 [Catharanthus roseus]